MNHVEGQPIQQSISSRNTFKYIHNGILPHERSNIYGIIKSN